MDDNIRDWIERKDEHISRTCEGLKPDIANVLEAMSWLCQVDWHPQKAKKLVEYLNEYGKPEALVAEMRVQWKEWKNTPAMTPEEMLERLSR